MTQPRSGKWVPQAGGYLAFLPAPLPPTPPVAVTGELMGLLSEGDRALGRLDGVASVLPNPDLFVAMYVRHEAVLSSQIEGTQSTLEDVLAFEEDEDQPGLPVDVGEVVNYVRALRHGLARMHELPVCNRLIRELHRELMQGVRGGEREPGSFRTTQNWIGPPGATPRTATFVPPPPEEVERVMAELERFLHAGDELPPLVHVGLAHAQFETIHPFLDGNGRVGRLLITLMLCERGILRRPLLYLSVYLKANRAEYYDRLTAVRTRGDWEGWLGFFLRGVAEVSESATLTARRILDLRERARGLDLGKGAQRLVGLLFEHPVVSVKRVQGLLGCTFATAGKALDELAGAGLVVEATGQRRNRRFRFDAYLRLFEQPALAPEGTDALRERTQG